MCHVQKQSTGVIRVDQFIRLDHFHARPGVVAQSYSLAVITGGLKGGNRWCRGKVEQISTSRTTTMLPSVGPLLLKVMARNAWAVTPSLGLTRARAVGALREECRHDSIVHSYRWSYGHVD